MNVASHNPPITWLRTDQPVVPMNSATWSYLPEVEAALHHGVSAVMDSNRPGFYEIEIGQHWYYVHVPTRLRAVYLVAAQNRTAPETPEVLEHQPAC